LELVANWLSTAGAKQPKEAYQDRLAALKKFGDPVHERFKEAEKRPSAVEGQILIEPEDFPENTGINS
jgi:hypothetical protein